MEDFDDLNNVKGFLDKDKILEYLTEEDIFNLVFNFKPEEYQYVCSPLRTDNSPGAYFERSIENNKLYLVDWADSIKVFNDCFDSVQRYFKLPNFYQTLLFIKKNLIDNKNIKPILKFKPSKSSETIKTEIKPDILFVGRGFQDQDKVFWSKYKISKSNLLEDKVFPVSKYVVVNSKKGNSCLQIAYTLCYVYTDFTSKNKKLYFPYKKSGSKFISTCGKNDIGGLRFLFDSPKLVITKSYKDYRVLKNQNLNVIWFQNEGVIPCDSILLPILDRYKEIIIFYDNDKAGIEASKKVCNYINSYYPNKSRSIHLPLELLEQGVKDPSDLIFKKGEQELKNFIYKNIIC